MVVCGHAGYSNDGNDIICAAVSGLVYALLGYLANEAVDSRINSFGQGSADIQCANEGEEAMKLCCIGLLQIALTYPDFLSVSADAWNWRIGSFSHTSL